MESRTKKLSGVLLTLLMAVVAMSVAYAALSTTLNITTNTVKNMTTVTWNIGFTGTSTAIAGGTSATGRSCGAATVTASSVTIADTTLSKPGDSCTYPLTISNNGTIAAKVQSIIPTEPSGITCTKSSATSGTSAQMVCGNYTYKLAGNQAGTVNFVTDAILNGGSTTNAYLIVSYTGESTSSTQITQSSGQFTVTYVQN